VGHGRQETLDELQIGWVEGDGALEVHELVHLGGGRGGHFGVAAGLSVLII
jgi:hypothetical protein